MKSTTRPTRVRPLAFSAKALRTCEPPISCLVAKALSARGLISFAAGLVDEATLPAAAAAKAAAAVFSNPRKARAALQYGTTPGLEALRKRLVRHIESLEGRSATSMGFGSDDILLTTGSQQSLYLIADVLLNPGDIVIVESPSYFVFTGALASLGARLIGIPMDEQGMQVEQLATVLEELRRSGELPRVKFVYCTSYFQNPTGLTLSLERRKRLLEIVKLFSTQHRIVIIEDAAYRELRYAGEGLPSIKSFDRENRYTVLTQTFSKPFAPGIKLGYTIVPSDLLVPVLRQKGNHDFGSPNVCQWLALEAMTSGDYARHVRNLQRTYRRKRDEMLACLKKTMPQGATWTNPQGGIYIWLTLPAGLQTGGEFFQRCIQAGVMYVPGEYAYAQDDAGRTPRNQLRLCFGQVPMAQIAPGIKRLGRCIEQAMSNGGRG